MISACYGQPLASPVLQELHLLADPYPSMRHQNAPSASPRQAWRTPTRVFQNVWTVFSKLLTRTSQACGVKLNFEPSPEISPE